MIARPPRWLIAAILADGAVLGALLALGFGILESDGPYEGPYFQLCGMFAFAIFAGVALWLWLRPSASRWGLAIGLHVIGIMIVGGWLILLALGLGMSSTLSDDDLRIVGSALGLLLAQLVLAVVTYRAAGRAGVESRLAVAHVGVWKLHVAGIFSLGAVLVIGLAWETVELARGNRGFDAIRGAVHRVQGCAARYADRHPAEGYAPTLGAMGPHGDGCLDARTIAGRDSNGVAIEYVAKRGEAGRVTSFVVTARGRGYRPIQTITGDTSGLAFNRGLQLGGSLYLMSFARNCLALYRTWYPNQPFPASFADLLRAAKQHEAGAGGAPLYGGCQLRLSDGPQPEEERVAELMETSDGHRLAYRPNGKDDYVLEARPLRYGQTAVRSYMMRNGGDLHVTLLDRPATDTDPGVETCEYAEHEQRRDCVFFPGLPPAVTFVHDTLVRRGSPYFLAARDPRDRNAPLGAELLTYLDCFASSPLDRSRPQSWGTLREISCASPERYQTDKQVVVRLWVMDRSGAMTALEDTLPVVEAPIQAGR